MTVRGETMKKNGMKMKIGMKNMRKKKKKIPIRKKMKIRTRIKIKNGQRKNGTNGKNKEDVLGTGMKPKLNQVQGKSSQILLMPSKRKKNKTRKRKVNVLSPALISAIGHPMERPQHGAIP